MPIVNSSRATVPSTLRAILAHDFRFRESGCEILADPQFSAVFWRRYLEHFDRLTIVARHGGEVDSDGANLVRSNTSGVEFKAFPDLSSLVGQLFARPAARRQMQKRVAASDVVVARLPSELGLLAAAAARRQNKVCVVEVLGCAWDSLWNYGNLRGRLYAPAMRARMRLAVSRAPFAIYVTNGFLQGRYPSRGISEGCSDVEIPSPSPAVLQRRLTKIDAGGEGRPLVLGLVGSLNNRYKGIQTVLAALARLRRNSQSSECRILGADDTDRWQTEAERFGVQDLVRFDGLLPAGEAVWRWLDDVDIYLQPSFAEGLPRTLVEAMSRACPALGSTAGGIPELLDRECLIKPGAVDELVRLLQGFIANREWRREQAMRNWEKARQFSGDVLDPRRDAFWAEVADCARSRRLAGARR